MIWYNDDLFVWQSGPISLSKITTSVWSPIPNSASVFRLCECLFLLWNFQNYWLFTTCLINDKHFDARACISSELGKIVFELQVRQVLRYEKSQWLFACFFCSFKEVCANFNRFKVLLGLFDHLFCTIIKSDLHLYHILEERNLWTTTKRLL